MSTLIVNGPPGSGKSTVARLLAGESRRGVHLPADVFWHFIVGHVPPGLPEAEEQNQSVITALASASAVYDRGDYEVFVDGFVRPAYLEIFLETYGRRPLDHVVLMPSLETAVQRACARGESDPTVLLTSDELAAPELIAEQVERRYALFADTPNILATDGLTTEQTAAAIRANVHSGRARINPA
jgi:adenylate kinase family enzyme